MIGTAKIDTTPATTKENKVDFRSTILSGLNKVIEITLIINLKRLVQFSK